MAIKIIEEPDVYLSREEFERLSREYAGLTHMVNKPDFETWVRQGRAQLANTRSVQDFFANGGIIGGGYSFTTC